MEPEKQTIVVTTPDELSRLIFSAVRSGLHDMEQIGPKKKKMLAPKEIQQEYGIHRRILESWRLQGIGPAFTNIGRRVFYDRAVLEKFLAAGKIKTTGWVDQ